jgi:DNA-binding HxlR family transcriptional regulator
MLHRTYDDQVCSVARTLEVLGERWTLLIVRDALLGLTRFDEFQQNLGLARNILTDRLNRLVEADVLERVEYQQRPPRSEYRLTAKGRELGLPLVALMHWGDRHLADAAGPPRLTRHRHCDGLLRARLVCETCGTTATAGDLEIVPGPGLPAAPVRHSAPGTSSG